MFNAHYRLYEGLCRFGNDVVMENVAQIVGSIAGFVGPERPGDIGPGVHVGYDRFKIIACQGCFIFRVPMCCLGIVGG